ncbi:MAG: hypothetical protein BRD57_02655, partial [Proteobacteria bacterium SW_6_67_9]
KVSSFMAEARIQGQDAWEAVPACEDRDEDRDDCSEDFRRIGQHRPHLDLSEYVGQQVELALRIQMPHPTLLENPEGEPSFALQELSVDAGYLRLIDIDMQLRGWTDPSIQGEGWDVRGVELFGLPIQANVGTNELESKALVGDRLHVHADPAADRDVFMSVPFNLTVYNQGVDAQTLPLEASMEARNDSASSFEWVYSDSEEWASGPIDAPGTCDVEIRPEEVQLDPGESKQVSSRVVFVPEGDSGWLDPTDVTSDEVRKRLGQCFPGQFADGEHLRKLDFRMNVNLTDGPEDDYVASDDTLTQRLRPNRWVRAGVRLASMGYAIPGPVLAVGILIPFGWLDNTLNTWAETHLGVSTGLALSGSLFILVFAYAVRFMTAAVHTVESGLSKVPPSMDEAARSFGYRRR